MDWARRQAGALLGLGLGGGVVWAAVVGLSMPSWFEPDESCVRKFPDVRDVSEIRTSWFPPSASCVYGDDVREYMSTTRSVILTVVGVLLLGLIVVGLIRTVRRRDSGDGSVSTADGTDLALRRRSHLMFGALGIGGVLVVLTFVGWVAIVFGALPGTALFAVAALSWLWAVLLGAITYAVVAAAQWSRVRVAEVR